VTEHERDDLFQATIDARRYPLAKGTAPHYLRCTWYRGSQRCQLAEGHSAKHDYAEVPVEGLRSLP
jgi:hypothetical protein